MTAVSITSAGGETVARFEPEANLVCSSLRHRDGELLEVGDGVAAYATRGATMGIPLLYPWANRLSRRGYEAAGRAVTLPAPEGRYALDPNGLPIHGALPGELRWEVDDHFADRLLATLRWDGPRLLELFPFVHEVQVEAAVFEQGLALTTIVEATGSDPVPIAFGYHPYLRIPGSDRRGWQVDLGASEQLVLDERMIPTGEREPLARRDFLLGDESFDDAFIGLSDPAQFLVGDGETELSVSFEAGYGWAQMYAPAGRDFVCFEPMTAPTDALNRGEALTVIAPGERYRASFRVTVLP